MASPATPTTPKPPSSSSIVGSLDDRLSGILSSEQFSVAKYLNTALEGSATPGSTGQDDVSQRMTELALQLQLQTQTCHEEIGRISAELQAIMPRCAADVGRVGVGLDGLRRDAAALLEAISVDGESEVSASLETLTTLHALQANLTRTKQILSAAATWDSTISSVAGLLAAQNLSEAVNALAQLENGERALRGMPHPEQRREQIEHIRQQVSAMLAPQLKHALANMTTRIAPLQQCVTLYAKLHKMDALKEEYVKNRPTAIHKAWFEYSPPTLARGPSAGVETAASEKAAESFATWLPGWFDAVLSLVTEERRQSMAVFGPEAVPEMTIKVFRECFRPLSTSFKSRLEAICSSNPASPVRGSLESVSAVYESTLQFFSLVYDALSGSFLDLVEAGTLPSDSGVELYKCLVETFVTVAAPFSPYQERLSQLEARYSGDLSRQISSSIRVAVALESPSLETIQIAVKQLRDLSGACFPLAAGAVARLELLTGGYSASQCLATIDEILADTAGELALAMHTLSNALVNDAFADNFDDSYVLGALEALKIAGSFQRDSKNLEEKTRERLRVLLERQTSYAHRESHVNDAVASTDPSRSRDGGFDFPDSMSPVDIDSIITKNVCGHSEGDDFNLSISVLRRLSSSGERVFAQVEEARHRLATSCQAFVFNVLFAIPRRHLGSMSSMASWRQESGSDDLSYGTLPQQYITQVGEHMLALVQALEPFASDRESLALANAAMSGVKDVSLPPWRDLIKACNYTTDNESLRALMAGKELTARLLSHASADDDMEEDEEGDKDATAGATFCNAWLDVVGLAVTGQLLERVTRIPSLSAKGCEHLNADLDYLVNVFSALGVQGHPHPLLAHLGQLAVIEGDVLASRISNFRCENSLDSALLAIEERLAAIRGVAARFNY